MMRAESAVIREMLIAPTREPAGTVAPIRALRTPMSDGRAKPASAVVMNMYRGESMPVNTSVVMIAASIM
jgi:hypothetical protein